MSALVVIRGSTPLHRFHVYAAAPEPSDRERGYEERPLSRPFLRASYGGVAARNSIFGSPGRYVSSAIFCGIAFARRQAIGGDAGTNRTPIAALNFRGTILRASRSPFSDALLQACKQSRSSVSDALKTLSCALVAHVGNHHSKGLLNDGNPEARPGNLTARDGNHAC